MALVLGVLALTRFSAFVLVLLAARSSLDLVKLSSGGAAERWQDPASLVSVALLLASVVWLLVQVGCRPAAARVAACAPRCWCSAPRP